MTALKSLGKSLWNEAEVALSSPGTGLSEVIAKVGSCSLHPEKPGSLFDCLLSAIIYQQLSGKAAKTIYGRVCALFPRKKPAPRALLKLTDEQLRGAGLSRPKMRAARNLAEACISTNRAARDKGSDVKKLPSLKKIESMTDDEIREALTAVKGIGPWTVNMFLMFDLGRPNILPENDLGIQKAVGRLYYKGHKATPQQVLKHGVTWAPWCTIASWYLWRSLDIQK